MDLDLGARVLMQHRAEQMCLMAQAAAVRASVMHASAERACRNAQQMRDAVQLMLAAARSAA